MPGEPLEKTSAPAHDPLAPVRHELRTPLNQIIGYSEMLIEEAEESGQDGFIPDLKKVHSAAKRLVELIQEHLGPGKQLPASPAATPEPALETNRQPAPVLPSEAQASEESIPAGMAPLAAAPAPGKAEASLAQASSEQKSHLLVVDDNEANRDMLGRRLERQGYRISTAADGHEALKLVSQEPFDLVLLDIMMPGIDGYAVLERMKRDPHLRHIPVIMISALDELQGVVRCVEIGAEDYLSKPFEPTLLRARIGACLDKKRLRDQEQRTYHALVESQERLAAELAEAADYVKSLLPPPLSGELRVDWRFVPSTQLGGDAFGYHWLDADHFVMYLLDVCGHGVGAALLSISVMNVLRAQSLPATDFRDPGAVLSALNDRFPMENQNDMYFTMWYGVYQKGTHRLVYASGGHPPAILVPPGVTDGQSVASLRTPGSIIGGMPGSVYRVAQCEVSPGSVLYVFSDGTYEISRQDGAMWDYDEFLARLISAPAASVSALDNLLAEAQSVHGQAQFEDDFSMMRIEF